MHVVKGKECTVVLSQYQQEYEFVNNSSTMHHQFWVRTTDVLGKEQFGFSTSSTKR